MKHIGIKGRRIGRSDGQLCKTSAMFMVMLRSQFLDKGGK